MADPPRRATEHKFIGRTPSREVRVPHDRQREATYAEIDRLCKKWKSEYNCDVRALGGSGGPITKFEIYGSGSGVDKTHKEIAEWILPLNEKKSKHSLAWAKIPAYNDWQWSWQQLREQESDQKQQFKGEAPEDVPFSKIIEWPEELLDNEPNILPKDVFGLKLEGLDEIRLGEEVYISNCKTRKWAIQVQGHNRSNVQAAVDRIRKLIQKICYQISHFMENLVLVLDEDEGNEVLLEEAPGWWPFRNHTIVPRLIHDPSIENPGIFRRTVPYSSTVASVQNALKRFLELIKCEKGYYNLSIRYGVFVLQSSSTMKPESEIGKTYPFTSFTKHVETTNGCEVKRWLMNDKEGRDLLTRMMDADKYLEQTGSTGFFGYTSSLTTIQPLLRATFMLKDEHGKVNLVQIDWTDDEDGAYEKMEPRYFQLKPDTSVPKENMDIKLIELNESKAWQFSLVSMMPINKKLVPPAVRSFATGVSIKPDGDPTSSVPPLVCKRPDSSLKFFGGRIEKIYTFSIKGSGYMVDLVGRWYYQGKGVTPCCWGIDVRHKDWETHLSQMERLESGKSADWEDTISTFFPDDGHTAPPPSEAYSSAVYDSQASPPRKGTRVLLEILMQLSTFINDPE
ncbi:hypothetical protein DM02DRAFT_590162 [Periconia macrospinosa]|uniref:DUF7905 domain-containing protein n=1 Tax=Periconia macrospinosa TaxID=97972 RepID=A0A2V1DYT7_9PLEO|nr:hypothetical protein DM02DRAFT_590162 [Periconia macrospinosa]